MLSESYTIYNSAPGWVGVWDGWVYGLTVIIGIEFGLIGTEVAKKSNLVATLGSILDFQLI